MADVKLQGDPDDLLNLGDTLLQTPPIPGLPMPMLSRRSAGAVDQPFPQLQRRPQPVMVPPAAVPEGAPRTTSPVGMAPMASRAPAPAIAPPMASAAGTMPRVTMDLSEGQSQGPQTGGLTTRTEALGRFGRVGHVLGEIGKGFGEVFVPQVMPEYRRMKEAQLEHERAGTEEEKAQAAEQRRLASVPAETRTPQQIQRETFEQKAAEKGWIPNYGPDGKVTGWTPIQGGGIEAPTEVKTYRDPAITDPAQSEFTGYPTAQGIREVGTQRLVPGAVAYEKPAEADRRLTDAEIKNFNDAQKANKVPEQYWLQPGDMISDRTTAREQTGQYLTGAHFAQSEQDRKAAAAALQAQRDLTNEMARERLADEEAKRRETLREFVPAVQQSIVQQTAVNTGVRRLLTLMEPLKNDNRPFANLPQYLGYRLGGAQANEIGQALSAINLDSLMQAGAVLKSMGGTRAASVIAKVMQHTPDPARDSIKNMYQKLKTIDQAQVDYFNEADKYGRKAPAELDESLKTPYQPATAEPKSMSYSDMMAGKK